MITRTRPDGYKFPFKHIAAVSLCFSAGIVLTPIAKSGEDLASLTLLAAIAVGTHQSLKVMDGVRTLNASRGKYRKLKSSAKKIANADVSTLAQLEEAGLFAKQGIILGEVKDKRGNWRLLCYDGPNAVLIVGPPAAQKSTAHLINSLLPTFHLGGIGHSVIANDPSGEMFAVTHKALEAAGYEVLCLTAWPELMSERLGVPVVDAGLDIWAELDIEGDPKRIPDIIRSRMVLLFPDDPKEDAKDRFFRDGGRRLVTALCLYVIARRSVPSLPMLRRMLLEGPKALQERLSEAALMTEFESVLADEARGLADIAANSPEQFAGYLGTALQGLEIYDHFSPMGNHFRADGLKPSILKEKPVVVFIMYPTEKTSTHKQAINFTLSYVFEQLAIHPNRQARVTALIDEAAGIGYIPNLLKALNEYRKYGLRIVLAYQDLTGQTEQTFGKFALKQIVGACEVIVASNIREPEMLSMLSKKTGITTVRDGAMGDPQGGEHSATDQKYNWSHKTRPVMREDEIRQLPTDQALVLFSNLPVTIVTKVPYWTKTIWSRIAGRNPSHGG